jgi:hypothetical protein
MRIWITVLAIVGLSMGLSPVVSSGKNLNACEDECIRTAHSQIYSNAVFIEDAGDVVGFELAVQRSNHGSSVSALLYDYEGVPNEDGISLSGQILGKELIIEGNWVRHLTEMPSKKQIVETRHVKVNGKIDSTRFRGTIKIEDLDTPINVRLKRVDHIWMCKRQTKPKLT